MADVVPLSGHYRVILADPPWTFATYSAKGKGRSAEAHYNCMSLDEIKGVPVLDWAAENCVLFLWATEPTMPRALEVIQSWGFTYKTFAFTWVKGHMAARYRSADDLRPFDRLIFPIGCGYWTRANPEPCLLATRGKPKRLSAAVRELIVSPRREHSRKPDEVYGRIEALCAGPYLELFARFRREGWDRWGDQDGVSPRRWRSDMAAE